ncbi:MULTISPECIES: OprD family porin [unclassified Pseudomonas]|uniref:OprD family porin n=1 Tax=unclassified Pseudomonas TaxID=196821 RepID=UPI000BD3E4C3|nr:MULTISPECIES: OprD family porin [unclassified Pseudomonas]PVZ20430.1 outer membrane OprD family porin [Pseudomonas sp. URIL14HWK12:I12]PVZ27496.1 outer membrane OprD family porin [Pseudomonas sp. URIL14HWK12:I10]PVZ38385.1 outer membrane OprD family porin [Pseudomonas sp. URIL14HWK12:I11]SNZ03567.1 outer membrane porin, OprD family [Pseudomonas sp. URIL14HWK12:I9]
MYKSPASLGFTSAAALGLSLAFPGFAEADLLEDSKAELEFRNFYFNSDYRQAGAAQSKRDEWAQGLLLTYESGFTDGPVGFGVDAIGLFGLKLDSGPERRNSGLLPVGDEKAPGNYGRAGVAAKARVAKSVLRAGTLMPKLPTVLPNDGRLLPQTFRGAQLTSKDITDLTLNLGRLTRNTERNDSGHELIEVEGKGIRGGQASDRFDFASASYNWTKGLTTAYHYGALENNYQQHIVTLLHNVTLAPGQSLKSDLRYARSLKDGNTNIDNTAIGARFTYTLQSHSFGVAYQKMKGVTGFAHLAGTDSFLVNYVMISPDFANPQERSWQARYDYDFAALGVPGLSFMTRYLQGDHFARGNKEGTEWERNTDLAYVFQSGPLKNLELKWRNGTYRSNGGNNIDQNRVIVSYTLPLL